MNIKAKNSEGGVFYGVNADPDYSEKVPIRKLTYTSPESQMRFMLC